METFSDLSRFLIHESVLMAQGLSCDRKGYAITDCKPQQICNTAPADAQSGDHFAESITEPNFVSDGKKKNKCKKKIQQQNNRHKNFS